MIKVNQDIREYMTDHCVTQKDLAVALGTSQWTVCQKLKEELPQEEKERWLNIIDSISCRCDYEDDLEEQPEDIDQEDCAKFLIGDRVKIPAKQDAFGVVSDIWSSVAQGRTMYEVTAEITGHKCLYAEEQLEPAPVPTEYSWEAHIDGNVAVVTMHATQGEKTWIYARGHAHIIHSGEVGMAQAISYAARRMFEELDKKQENKIYARN